MTRPGKRGSRQAGRECRRKRATRQGKEAVGDIRRRKAQAQPGTVPFFVGFDFLPPFLGPFLRRFSLLATSV